MSIPNSEVKPTSGANRVCDELMARLQLKNDAALARALEVPREVISKIRHGKRTVGPLLLIRMHEVSELSIADLRTLIDARPSD